MTLDKDMRQMKGALCALMLAGAFVIEPEVWPGFAAFVERSTGNDVGGTPDLMEDAIVLLDEVRAGLGLMADGDTGTPYTRRRAR